ncbi:hypothetical protein A0H81_07023 [Grifola frondosa]|uniref:Uncharacterized protein n=1 Tax=Grifola frondosa TaxID=5627 RepID=A0A1C7M8H1_GRIFR|nr:hypothetical protein A0H81_07023 [Grifola frondosa]
MWPQHIINNFRSIPEDSPLGNDYYGVYNKVLFLEFFERPKFAINPIYALPDFEKPASILSMRL